jgi:hypothetical protein
MDPTHPNFATSQPAAAAIARPLVSRGAWLVLLILGSLALAWMVG